MDIPWELNGKIDFSGISIYDGARQKIALEVFRELNQDFNMFGTSFKDVFPKFDEGDEKEEVKQYWEFMEGMQWGDRVLPEGRLVMMEKGWLGAAMCDICSGDVVAVLEGYKLPVVLRAFGERWRLVGSIYAHGIMEGEVMVVDNREKRTAEIFEIY